MDSSDRIERLLVALLLQSMRTAPLKEKVFMLNLVGFSNLDIADLLMTSPQVVAQYIYATRKRMGRQKTKRKAKPEHRRKK